MFVGHNDCLHAVSSEQASVSYLLVSLEIYWASYLTGLTELGTGR